MKREMFQECRSTKELLMMFDDAEKQDMAHPHDDGDDYFQFYHGRDSYDDVNGEQLETHRAIKARKLEIDFLKRMEVYAKVGREEARFLKAKLITTRWIDTNKGDDHEFGYRSRFAGREITTDQRFELCVAILHLESLRMMFAICASNQHGSEPYHLLSSGSKRGYLFAEAKHFISIEIPEEDREPGDEGQVGRFKLSLHGMRGVTMDWQDELIAILERHGFVKGKVSPCNHHNEQRKLSVNVHGDDFTSIGTQRQFKWFEAMLNQAYECKHQWLGFDVDEEKPYAYSTE